MVGSRDETLAENGLTHFLEHMAFKGTVRRTAADIAREIDQMGGACNAFTTKEATCFHARVLKEHLPRAIELLSDLVLNPVYQEKELELERQIILEEIYSQEDEAEELIQVEFARNLWKDCAFGRSILGEVKTVAGFCRDHLVRYRQATYRPEQMVVAAAGRLCHEELVDLVGPLFEHFSNGARPRSREAVTTNPGTYLFARDLEQVHLCLGTPGLAAADPRRYGATLLQLILGGNMSSRLFQVIREHLGLAYTIYSFMSFFSDHGLLGICAGVSPKNLHPLVTALNQELHRLKKEPVPAAELAAAQEYFKASIYLHAEDCDQRMMRLAKNEILLQDYLSLPELVAGLMKVTVEDVHELAQTFFAPEKWGFALLGPVAEPLPQLDF